MAGFDKMQLISTFDRTGCSHILLGTPRFPGYVFCGRTFTDDELRTPQVHDQLCQLCLLVLKRKASHIAKDSELAPSDRPLREALMFEPEYYFRQVEEYAHAR